MNHRISVCAISLAAALAVVAPRSAAAEDSPWSTGVSSDRQAQANKLFAEGNELYAQQAHGPAAEKYRAALELWDHPLIRYNLATALIRLDKPLEASEELEKALRYGSQPFKPELYSSAQDYQALLKGRVGWLEVSCEQAGTKISIDGKPLFNCPGSQKVRILAGEHSVGGEQKDFLSVNRRVVVPGGDTLKESIKLIPLDQAVVLKYKYPRWVPWTVAGVSAGVAAGGLLTYLSGRSLMADYDQRFSANYPKGISEEDLKADASTGLYEQRESAKTRGTIGISLMAAGGVGVAAGVIFALVINRPYRELPNVEVSPTVGGATANVSLRF